MGGENGTALHAPATNLVAREAPHGNDHPGLLRASSRSPPGDKKKSTFCLRGRNKERRSHPSDEMRSGAVCALAAALAASCIGSAHAAGHCTAQRCGGPDTVGPRGALRLRGGADAGVSTATESAAAEKELGNTLYAKKDFEGALMHYTAAAGLEPTAIVYLNNMAAALFGLQKYQECLDTCKKAVEVGKEHRADFKDLARAYARMGNALVKLGDLEAACEQYDNSLMEHKDPQVALKAKDTRRLIEKKAAEAYLDPEKAEECRKRGNELFKEGKWVDAIREYSDGLKRDPNNHLIYSNRGAAYIKVMDLGSALRDCEKCIELRPDFPRAYARKATVEILCKQVHKAKETVELGLKVSPDDLELKDVQRKVQMQVMGVGLSQEEREQRAKEAMKDPKIVQIMQVCATACVCACQRACAPVHQLPCAWRCSWSRRHAARTPIAVQGVCSDTRSRDEGWA